MRTNRNLPAARMPTPVPLKEVAAAKAHPNSASLLSLGPRRALLQHKPAIRNERPHFHEGIPDRVERDHVHVAMGQARIGASVVLSGAYDTPAWKLFAPRGGRGMTESSVWPH